MNAITLMVEEHKNIKRVLEVIRKLCIDIVNGKEVNFEVFEKVIDFVKNYADKHHHKKEENILFKKMSNELGENVAKGPIYGMFAEHDLGRLYIKNLEIALEKAKEGYLDSKVDIIGNAIAYTDLLYRHIDKENNAIYKFGEKSLSNEALQDVENKCQIVEQEASKKNLQEKYLKLIDELAGIVLK